MALQRSNKYHPPVPEEALGQAVREFRLKRGLSQEALAHQAGVDRTYTSLIERGLKSPTVRMLFRLSEVLKVPVSSILRRTETIIAGTARSPNNQV